MCHVCPAHTSFCVVSLSLCVYTHNRSTCAYKYICVHINIYICRSQIRIAYECSMFAVGVALFVEVSVARVRVRRSHLYGYMP